MSDETPWQVIVKQLLITPAHRALPEERRSRRIVSARYKCVGCGKCKGATAFRKLESDMSASVISARCRKCGG